MYLSPSKPIEQGLSDTFTYHGITSFHPQIPFFPFGLDTKHAGVHKVILQRTYTRGRLITQPPSVIYMV